MLITLTDGGRRDNIQRQVYEQIKKNFAFMIAVGVCPEVEEVEIRKLSTKGRSLHIKNFDSKFFFVLRFF